MLDTLLITATVGPVLLVLGLGLLLRADVYQEVFTQMRNHLPVMFVVGLIELTVGVAMALKWYSWDGGLPTFFTIMFVLMIMEGTLILLLPRASSMAIFLLSQSRGLLQVGGVILIAMGVWLTYLAYYI